MSSLQTAECAMRKPANLEELAEVFRAAGAARPEQWAKSQVGEGINQLHRFLFLRQAWRGVVPDGSSVWIDDEVQRSRDDPTAPFAGIGGALERLKATGASVQDLTALVRGMQARLLFDLCYLLEDPSIDEPALSHIGWALVETSDDSEPTQSVIRGLHESVLETDPTGREMRPRQED